MPLRSLLQRCAAGAEALGSVLGGMALEVINMNRNSIGDAGACALGLAAQRQRTLRELHVRSNCIKERGALALAVALKSVSSMAVVDLRGNSFPSTVTKIEYMLQECTRDVHCLL
jgi:Ran GTPase-activating protein (RanGAP) involved in mRNA processing and transport